MLDERLTRSNFAGNDDVPLRLELEPVTSGSNRLSFVPAVEPVWNCRWISPPVRLDNQEILQTKETSRPPDQSNFKRESEKERHRCAFHHSVFDFSHSSRFVGLLTPTDVGRVCAFSREEVRTRAKRWQTYKEHRIKGSRGQVNRIAQFRGRNCKSASMHRWNCISRYFARNMGELEPLRNRRAVLTGNKRADCPNHRKTWTNNSQNQPFLF